MKKSVLLWIFSIIVHPSLHSQNIYYSPIENDEPSKTVTFVIGEINHKLLIWKDDRQAHTSTLLVYNDRMEIVDRVSEKLAGNNIIGSLKFFKTASGFYVIFEYNTQKNEYYCKENLYDENGKQVGATKIIDYQKLKDDGNLRLNYMKMLMSEQRQCAVLYRQYITSSLDSMVLEYIRLGNNNDSSKFKILPIPLHNRGQLTNLLLDENGDLLLGESYPTPDSAGTVLKIYKQICKTDSLRILKQVLTGSYLWGTRLIPTLENNGYIVTGMLSEKPIANANKYQPTGLFTSVINLDLQNQYEPQVTDFSSISSMPKYDNVQIRKVMPSPDGGFYLYLINNELYQTNVIKPYTESLGYREMRVSSYSNIIPDGFRFSKYGYREDYLMAQQSFASPMRVYNFPNNPSDITDQLKAMSLIVFKFNGKSELESGGVLKGDAESGFISRVDMSASFLLGNDIHFIYPKIINERKQIIGEISFDASGKSKVSPIIANHLKYSIRTTTGVKINDHSVVFEYDNNYKFGFAKVDY